MWLQKELHLNPYSRGFHLITEEVISALPEIKSIDVGLLTLFVKHTSASLTINENADPTVRSDLEAHFDFFVPERATYYQHTYEGDDDMPAHIKASILGSSIIIPISNGHLNLGVWQGIYLGEHRVRASNRTLIATIQGNSSRQKI